MHPGCAWEQHMPAAAAGTSLNTQQLRQQLHSLLSFAAAAAVAERQAQPQLLPSCSTTADHKVAAPQRRSFLSAGALAQHRTRWGRHC
jgi:hypothetical protein